MRKVIDLKEISILIHNFGWVKKPRFYTRIWHNKINSYTLES